MFALCGYNFCKDGDCLNPAPTNLNNINNVTLENGIYDHFNVTQNVSDPYSPDIPTAWDYLTIMDANFEGNIDAGNVKYALDQLSGFKIKRRKLDEYEWVTLKFIPIEDTSELQFLFNDNLAANLKEYEYAFVPVINEVEGNYITNTIGTKFDGVFICDLDTIYKFYANVKYGTDEQVQRIGVFEPFGRKYPVLVSNGLLNYKTGSVSGLVLNQEYLDTNKIDYNALVKERKDLLNFLTNKKAKILKGWNGDSILMMITGSPSTEYLDYTGMGLANVLANYTEIGDSNNQADLYNTGMVQEEN